MKLRSATKEDIPLLKAWDEKPHVKSAGGDDDWYDWDKEIPRDAAWGDILIAEEAGRPVGVVEIIDPAEEPSRYWGDVGKGFRAIDIWIGEETDLGRGLGARMMRRAFDRCFSDKTVTAILIDPLEGNARARRFYERLGFEFLERRIFERDACAVYRLDRATYERLAARA